MSQAPSRPAQIFVVDDDPAVRETLAVVFAQEGYEVVGFADGAAMLAAARACSPTCIILDVHIPGQSGLDILKELNARDYPVPTFMMSGKGDIAMAVDAIRNGALDFIEKPFRGNEVVTRVREAVAAYARQQSEQAPKRKTFHFPGREPLTAREQDVLAEIVGGASNKEAGRQLGISPRTIEVHRARIMEKLGAKNTADLIRIALSEGR